jgi:hypothetical protein
MPCPSEGEVGRREINVRVVGVGIMVAPSAHLSSLSSVPLLWRCYLRQEPDAAIPLVRIRGGGHGQP